jgi:hypothetical protein
VSFGAACTNTDPEIIKTFKIENKTEINLLKFNL